MSWHDYPVMGSIRVLGTCSLCGGRVVIPGVWMGVVPPTPHCQSCGAEPEARHGPVIPMRAMRISTTDNTTAVSDNLHLLWPEPEAEKKP